MNKPILKFYDDGGGGYEKALESLKTSNNHKVHHKVDFPNSSQIELSNQQKWTVYRGIYLDTERQSFRIKMMKYCRSYALKTQQLMFIRH